MEASEQALSGSRVKALVSDQTCVLPMMDVAV